MKKILVIGENSYIGKKLESYIHEKFQKEILITMVSASDGAWKTVDFSSYDSVLHLSAIVHRKEKKSLEDLYYKVNHKLAVDVARKAKDSRVGQYIFMSTAAVYNPKETRITKETVPNPKTYYGMSKLSAENEILPLNEDSFYIVIIRLPMVYGDGCKGNYQKLVRLAKFLPIFPEYHNKRSMIYIDKLCEFIAHLILTNEHGIFYPQDDNYIDTCEMVVNIRKDIGKKTFLTTQFNFLIRLLIPRISSIKKMFGDLYYDIQSE